MAGPNQDPFNPLRAQLRAVRTRQDVGSVSALARDHVDVTGLQLVAAIGDRVQIADVTFGEILSIGPDSCRVMADGTTAGLRLGMRVVNLGSPMIAPCDGWLGRIVDPYGGAMDGRPLPLGDVSRAISSAPPPPATRRGLGAVWPRVWPCSTRFCRWCGASASVSLRARALASRGCLANSPTRLRLILS
jgi:flagellum-specific ATP synthase